MTTIAYSAAAREHAGISLLLAHGAGANQTRSFMINFATALAARGIDTVTFQLRMQRRSQTRSGPERQAESVLELAPKVGDGVNR